MLATTILVQANQEIMMDIMNVQICAVQTLCMNKAVVTVPSAQTRAALAEDTELLSLNEKLDATSASSDCTHNPAFLFRKYTLLVKVTCLGFWVVLLHQGLG